MVVNDFVPIPFSHILTYDQLLLWVCLFVCYLHVCVCVFQFFLMSLLPYYFVALLFNAVYVTECIVCVPGHDPLIVSFLLSFSF